LNIKKQLKSILFEDHKTKKVDDIVKILLSKKELFSILLGGSNSYKNDLNKADVDLFCLVDFDNSMFQETQLNISNVDEFDQIIYQGFFPWTGEIYTVYFKDDLDFSIDLCFVKIDEVKFFFWEPNAIILYDLENEVLNSRKKQMSKKDYTRQPFLKTNPFSLSVITIKKIEKNIQRNHLWNALELLSILRRYTMQIFRLNVLNEIYFLGRVDRDIEDILPKKINTLLINTVPIYDKDDIALKTVSLINCILDLKNVLLESNENEYFDWIIKQLLHEKSNLLKIIKNA
jgi:hypothetical protein